MVKYILVISGDRLSLSQSLYLNLVVGGAGVEVPAEP